MKGTVPCRNILAPVARLRARASSPETQGGKIAANGGDAPGTRPGRLASARRPEQTAKPAIRPTSRHLRSRRMLDVADIATGLILSSALDLANATLTSLKVLGGVA